MDEKTDKNIDKMDKTDNKMDKKPMVVAINSVSGGGKTAAANALKVRLANSRVIYFDHYDDVGKNIPDIPKWIEDGEDYDLLHMESMVNDIKKFIKENETPGAEGIEYIILDYPFGYRQKQIADYIDLSVYIDTPLDIALARRIIRDISVQSKIDEVIGLLTGYLDARGAYCYSQSSSKNADFTIDGSLPVDAVTDTIIQKIEEKRAADKINGK